MPDVAVIACDHGLGHIRRVVAVLEHLDRVGDLTGRLFAPLKSLVRLRNWEPWEHLRSRDNVQIVDFETTTSLDRLERDEPRATRWHEHLPELDEELVWSDNLPEVLEIREDAVLSGSFFWHEVVAAHGRADAFVGRSRELVERHQPLIVGNTYFATREVRSCVNFHPVGLYSYGESASTESKSGVFLGAGTNDLLRAELTQLVSGLACRAYPPDGFSAVMVEPRLLPQTPPQWMRPADFTQKMFASVSAACIRPGMGYLSDFLLNGARVFAVAEPDNFEMVHNAQVVTALEVGQMCAGFEDAVIRASEFQSDRSARDSHRAKVGKLRRDGVSETSRLLRGVAETYRGERTGVEQ